MRDTKLRKNFKKLNFVFVVNGICRNFILVRRNIKTINGKKISATNDLMKSVLTRPTLTLAIAGNKLFFTKKSCIPSVIIYLCGSNMFII
jgi:hypothetical protein